jgi:hypothetical protein
VRTALALLLLGAAVVVAAEPLEAPLGPYARPGIPVLLRSETPREVWVGEWRFDIGVGVTWVHPPHVPCVVRDREGGELLSLAAVPEDARLVGVVGDVPRGLGASVRAVRIRPQGLRAQHWRALDLFDRIVVTAPPTGDSPWVAALTDWVRAGGSLVAPKNPLPLGSGLGRVYARLEDAGPVLEPRIPRAGNVRPDVYDLVPPPARRSRALRAARWIVVGAGAAFALQILLAALGRMRRRLLLEGLLVVALLGGAVGLVRTRSDYTPVARGRIEVAYIGGGVERRRTYMAFVHAGPHAVAPLAGAHTPILYRAGGDPWWVTPASGAPLEAGVTRVFLVEQVRPAPGATIGDGGSPPPAAFWDREGPRRGRWRAVAGPEKAPVADPDGFPVLRRFEVVLQD